MFLFTSAWHRSLLNCPCRTLLVFSSGTTVMRCSKSYTYYTSYWPEILGFASSHISTTTCPGRFPTLRMLLTISFRLLLGSAAMSERLSYGQPWAESTIGCGWFSSYDKDLCIPMATSLVLITLSFWGRRAPRPALYSWAMMSVVAWPAGIFHRRPVYISLSLLRVSLTRL